MKEFITELKEFITELVEKLINPKAVEKKKFDLKYELQVKHSKSMYLKDYLKTQAWANFHRPIIYRSLEQGIGTLLRDGLTMNETQIKQIIADMRANLNHITEMRFAIEEGEKAADKLEKIK